MTFSFLRKPLVFLAIFLATVPGARAVGSFTADLGQGLAYLRVRELPTGSSALNRPALVLDLRFITADATAAGLLAEQLRGRAPKPTFVLVNTATAASVLAALPKVPGLVTLGLPAAGFVPDLTVQTTAEQDRRAYDALAAGTPLEKLIDDTMPDKPRYDEAALAKDHAGGNEGGEGDVESPDHSPPGAAPPPASDSRTSTKEPPPRLLDLVLLRAVQLHRTLVALGKIPAG